MSEIETVTDDTAHEPQGIESGRVAGHEDDRTPRRPVLIGSAVLAGLLAFGIVVPTIVQMAFEAREERLSPPPNPLVEQAGRDLPPAPRLQVNAWRDIDEYRAAQRERLSSYGWVDRGAGIARIPIDRAIDLAVERAGGAPGASR